MSLRMRFVALGVATLVLMLGLFGFAYHPATSKLKQLKADVATSQAQVVQLQNELARLQALKKNEAALRRDADRFATALPHQPAISDFIRRVQDSANLAHLDFLSIAPSLPAAAAAAPVAAPAPAPGAPTPTPAPGTSAAPVAPPAPAAPAVQSIAISITAKGKFFPMKDFIHRLEHLPRALRVNTFSVSGSPVPGGGAPDLSVSLSLAIYTAPAVTVAAPPPLPVPTPGA